MRYLFFCSALVVLFSPAYISAQAPAPVKAVLEGEVVNAVTSAPIARARIKLDGPLDGPLYTRADDSGHFVFSDLAPGRYTLLSESPGFLRPMSIQVSLGIPQQHASGVDPHCVSAPVSATPAATADAPLHASVTISLTPYAVIAGRITDPYGFPLPDCRVEIQQSVPPGAGPRPIARPLPGAQMELVLKFAVRTNDKGEFRAAPLQPGTYYVVTGQPHISMWDSTFRNTYYPRALDVASAKPLALAAGQQARADIQILSQAGVRVTGHLLKPPGQAIPSGSRLSTSIALYAEQYPFLGLRSSQFFHISSGEDYEIEGVLPGKYTLTAVTRDVSSDPFGGNQKAVFGALRKVEVGDRDMVGLDVDLQPVRDIAGVVTFPEGCAAVPLRVSAQDHSFGGFPVETVSASDGKFLLSGIAAGRFTLYITTTQGIPLQLSSMRFGERDVLKNGFEMPYSGDDSLRVSVDCPRTGGLR